MKSAYRGFTPLNRRRHELITKRHTDGLSKAEARELVMLTVCVETMVWYGTDATFESAAIQEAAKELRTTGELAI